MSQRIELLGTLFFALALVHTFCVAIFARWANRFKQGSVQNSFLHLIAEVEVVFGLWAFLFLVLWSFLDGTSSVIAYQESLNMTEPLFIFCVLIIASSRPIIALARWGLLISSKGLVRLLPLQPTVVQFAILMSLGPLLGSVITEPAAMTIIALLIFRMVDEDIISPNLLYGIIALMFVNVSVGGALTHFAAPPILIVARTWNWGLADVFQNLGLAALITVLVNTLLFTIIFRKSISTQLRPLEIENQAVPTWIILVHLVFLAAIVATAHYSNVFFGLFLIFIGFTTVTRTYQDGLKFKEGFLVAFFLGGLVVFGAFQKWWLEPIIAKASEATLFLSAIGLTAITDNAALTYLGSQVPTITEPSKWALVAGALVGGGLTILANAPNPIGFSIMSPKFPNNSLSAVKLLMAALPPTLVAALTFYLIAI